MHASGSIMLILEQWNSADLFEECWTFLIDMHLMCSLIWLKQLKCSQASYKMNLAVSQPRDGSIWFPPSRHVQCMSFSLYVTVCDDRSIP